MNPDGNERLTSSVGLILVVLSLAEILTLLVGLQATLHVHVILGLMLIPPVALKLGSTGWRFARYYTRNAAYREKGAPQLLMRALAPLFVAATVALFGSGVAMGIVHGNALSIARRVHGPASVVWMILLGAHVLVYTPRALHAVAADVRARTRRAVTGARWRTIIVLAAIAVGVIVGLATLPEQHPWLHLSSRHHRHAGSGAASHSVPVVRYIYDVARTVVDSPIGPLGVVSSDAGLRAVLFDARSLRPEGSSPVLDEAARQLAAYFDGGLVDFDLPLDLHGTEFQRNCWLALRTIPYGQTVSYGEQARRLGLGPDAARAVGSANGSNPIPIVLPCHRVIGADGSLTGFGGGLHVKRYLLEHEGALLPLG